PHSGDLVPRSKSGMSQASKKIAIWGATGSIGSSALEVVAASEGRLEVVAISGHTRLDKLVDIARRFQPRWLVATDATAARDVRWRGLPADTELIIGPDGPAELARQPEIDLVLAAIVGSAGLASTWAAVEQGKTVALANKETMVMAGPLVRDLA